MDVQMPELNGIETTKKIRNLLALDVPVIACTAFSQPSEKTACIEAGMNDYLGKPVEEKELLRLLHKYLDLEVKANAEVTTLINFKQIQGITGNNKELMNVMLQKAMEAIPAELEQLHQAILSKNYKEVKELSHTMCSTLGLMGAPVEAMEMAKKMQSVADSEMNESLLQQFYNLNSIVEELIIQIRNYLAA
jgi:CheY-like chemotaxis protein